MKSYKKKVTGKKKTTKEADDEAIKKARKHGDLPDNMTSEEVKKKEGGNMTMRSYIDQILTPHVLPMFDTARAEGLDIILEEDNDGAHGTRSEQNIIVTFKKKHGIKYYANTPQSPDLSIIENVWRILKQAVKKHKAKSVDQLHWAIEYEWNQIPQEKINELVLTMRDHMSQVYEREGPSTMYQKSCIYEVECSEQIIIYMCGAGHRFASGPWALLRETFEKTGRQLTLYEDVNSAHGFQKPTAPNPVKSMKDKWETIRVQAPPSSPDFNPIEKVWRWIKSKLKQQVIQGIAEMKQAVRELWDQLNPYDFNKYWQSMPDHLRECKERNGLATTY